MNEFVDAYEKNKSTPLFLYFLDRELLETNKIYDKIKQKAISRDIRISLFSNLNEAYISSSFLFESIYAYETFKEYNLLFEKEKIVVLMTYDSLSTLVSVKKEQYRGKEDLFPNYFNRFWEDIAEKDVLFQHKDSDTTAFIANNIEASLNKKIIHKNDIIKIPYIIDKIANRNNQAITHHLFQDVYLKQGMGTAYQETINKSITELYISSYIDYFNLTIPTDLSIGIYGYDFLSKTRPVSDISFWTKVAKRLGLYDFLCYSDINCFYEYVESEEHRLFLSTMIKFLSDKTFCTDIFEKRYLSLINLLPSYEKLSISDITVAIRRVRDAYITLNEKIEKGSRKVMTTNKQTNVFVVHGRNESIKKDLFSFLRCIGLNPLGWEKAVSYTHKGTPTTMDIIDAGMSNSSAIIVLLTGDDKAKLHEKLWKNGEKDTFKLQPRPNVLLEAGMALAKYPDETILVKVGTLRNISDIDGINYVNLCNTAEARKNFITRLKTIGCNVDDSNTDWLTIGDFDVKL